MACIVFISHADSDSRLEAKGRAGDVRYHVGTQVEYVNDNFTTTHSSHTVLPSHYAKIQLIPLKRMSQGAHFVRVCASSVDTVPAAHFPLRDALPRSWSLSHGL